MGDFTLRTPPNIAGQGLRTCAGSKCQSISVTKRFGKFPQVLTLCPALYIYIYIYIDFTINDLLRRNSYILCYFHILFGLSFGIVLFYVHSAHGIYIYMVQMLFHVFFAFIFHIAFSFASKQNDRLILVVQSAALTGDGVRFSLYCINLVFDPLDRIFPIYSRMLKNVSSFLFYFNPL